MKRANLGSVVGSLQTDFTFDLSGLNLDTLAKGHILSRLDIANGAICQWLGRAS
jgi:hypothetical protein